MNETIQKPATVSGEDTIEKDLSAEQFTKREYNLTHLTYEREFSFYHAVQLGDLEEVNRIMLPLQNEGLGHLSDNPVRNMKYHLVITIALITRCCIEGGLLPEDAYSVSDLYIRRLDNLQTEEQISNLHREAVFAFTKKMKDFSALPSYSRTVSEIIDYVYDHLHGRIDLAQMANALSKNKTYLCDVFHRETGFTIGDYILRRKVEAAQNMLRFSDYTSADIGNYLGFANHSHFIASFKKITHMTPKEYRDAHYRNDFQTQAGNTTTDDGGK